MTPRVRDVDTAWKIARALAVRALAIVGPEHEERLLREARALAHNLPAGPANGD